MHLWEVSISLTRCSNHTCHYVNQWSGTKSCSSICLMSLFITALCCTKRRTLVLKILCSVFARNWLMAFWQNIAQLDILLLGGRPSGSGDAPIRLTDRHFPAFIPPTSTCPDPKRECHVGGKSKRDGKKDKKADAIYVWSVRWCASVRCSVLLATGLCTSPWWSI